MKKVILLFILVFFIAPTSAESFFEPEWEEFCPNKYSDISTSGWHYTRNGRYWSERRKDFERRLEKCRNLPIESQNACFENLRAIENNKSNYKARQDQTNVLNKIFINSMF